MSKPQTSKSQNYTWHQSGDEKNPRIAFIAPSNGLGQEVIKKRIELLVNKGFCVSYPLYESDSGEKFFLVDPRVRREGFERMKGSITPAVSETDGADQIIETIESGIDIMPLMGGESFEKKIPHILKYFADNPEKKNMAVRIFGLSNATFANYLAAQEICSFVSSPFVKAISDSDDGKKAYHQVVKDLLKVMKREPFEKSRQFKVLEGEICNISTRHYPLNVGTFSEAAQKEVITGGFNPAGNYSIEVEGFIELGSRRRTINIADCVKSFLEAHIDNPPQFMVCGLFCTRFDGAKGYNELFYDEEGLISVSDENIEAIFAKRSGLKTDMAAAIKDNSEKRKIEFSPEFTAKIQAEGELMKEDIVAVIKHENLQIKQLHADLKVVALEHGIPVLLSTDFGHASNMGIVPCGDYSWKVNEKNVSASCDLNPRPTKGFVFKEAVMKVVGPVNTAAATV